MCDQRQVWAGPGRQSQQLTVMAALLLLCPFALGHHAVGLLVVCFRQQDLRCCVWRSAGPARNHWCQFASWSRLSLVSIFLLSQG